MRSPQVKLVWAKPNFTQRYSLITKTGLGLKCFSLSAASLAEGAQTPEGRVCSVWGRLSKLPCCATGLWGRGCPHSRAPAQAVSAHRQAGPRCRPSLQATVASLTAPERATAARGRAERRWADSGSPQGAGRGRCRLAGPQSRGCEGTGLGAAPGSAGVEPRRRSWRAASPLRWNTVNTQVGSSVCTVFTRWKLQPQLSVGQASLTR